MYNPNQWKRSVDVQREDLNLKKIVSKNVEGISSTAKKERLDLIDNFHWVIMRFRRQKKLTQEQFANAISEPVSAIMMAEQGILPEKDYVLARKIENFLGIVIVKGDAEKKQETPGNPMLSVPKVLKFESNTTKELTIADLRRIKERKEFDVPDFEEDDGDEEEQNKEGK